MAFADTATLKDDFNRANAASLGANWTEPAMSTDTSSDWTIASNVAKPNGGSGTRSSAYYNVATYGPDGEAYFTITGTLQNNRYTEIYWGLHDGATPDGYAVRHAPVAGTDNIRLFRVDDDVFTQLGADIGQDFVAGDKLGVERSGSTLGAYRWDFNNPGWTQLGTRTDSTYTSAGNVGIGSNHTSPNVDDLYAGTVGGGGATNDETGGATSTASASGFDSNVFNETAGAQSPASASGADSNVFNESAGGQATGQPSGVDSSVFNEQAGAQAPASAASVTDHVVYNETGGVAGTGAASGADSIVFDETAGGTATAQASGSDANVFDETAGATATAFPSGSAAANAVYTVSGGVASPGLLASTDHTVYTETAGATSPATVTSTDHVVYVETAQAAAPGVVSGASEFESSSVVYTKTGGVQACGALGSTDQVVYSESGGATSPGALASADSVVFGETGGATSPAVALGATGAGNAPSDTSWVPFEGTLRVFHGESLKDRQRRERADEQPPARVADDEALLMLL